MIVWLLISEEYSLKSQFEDLDILEDLHLNHFLQYFFELATIQNLFSEDLEQEKQSNRREEVRDYLTVWSDC